MESAPKNLLVVMTELEERDPYFKNVRTFFNNNLPDHPLDLADPLFDKDELPYFLGYIHAHLLNIVPEAHDLNIVRSSADKVLAQGLISQDVYDDIEEAVQKVEEMRKR